MFWSCMMPLPNHSKKTQKWFVRGLCLSAEHHLTGSLAQGLVKGSDSYFDEKRCFLPGSLSVLESRSLLPS